jgi:hypothetical protein
MLPAWCSIALAVFVASIGAVVDPDRLHPTIQVWPPPFDLARAPVFLLSPYFLLCFVSAAGGIAFIVQSKGRDGSASLLPPEDQSVVIWWWLNITWFLTGCDCFSGLLGVMPNLTGLYKILNHDHSLPRFHPDRALMDTIYCCELVTIPLLLYTIVLYFRRDPARHVLDSFIAGLQICGAVAYYVPDIILGEHTSIITNVDRGVASFWVVINTIIFLGAVGAVREKAKKKSS